jgi:hypothetical protein
MGRYGNFYVGKTGFFYKKSGGGGVGRVLPTAAANMPHTVDNVYVPGSGVGASSISNRRARLLKATKCNADYPCSKSFSQLGLYARGGSNQFALNWY